MAAGAKQLVLAQCNTKFFIVGIKRYFSAGDDILLALERLLKAYYVFQLVYPKGVSSAYHFLVFTSVHKYEYNLPYIPLPYMLASPDLCGVQKINQIKVYMFILVLGSLRAT